MWRALALVTLLACQPKQPLQASYFNPQMRPQQGASCADTLACYAQCSPLTEECMLLCDRAGSALQVERARAVTYCSAQRGCSDQACTDEQCPREVQACTSPQVAPAPAPMRPQPYPGQVYR